MNAETRSKILKRGRTARSAKAVAWVTAILLAGAMAPAAWAQEKTQKAAAKSSAAGAIVNEQAAGRTASQLGAAPPRAGIAGRFATLPMLFEKNEGQLDGRVKFLSRGDGYTLFLTNDEMVMALARPPKDNAPSSHSTALAGLLTLRFTGAGADATIAGSGLLAGKTNYLLGSDPARWHANVPNYSAAEYQSLYPGVNAIFHGDKQQLEFDFEIAPGADPRRIALDVQGPSDIWLNSRGDAVLQLDGDTQIILGKPQAYQEIAGQRREVASNYVLEGKSRIRFSLSGYDASRAVVIDPTLTFSTYLAGVSLDVTPSLVTVAADSSGDAYVAGTTLSSTPTFPVKSPSASGPFQATCPGFCTNPVAFVMKIDPTQTGGNSLIYSTYFGPNDSTSSFSGFFTMAAAIAVDSSGDAYLAGNTNSGGLPGTSAGVQPTFRGTTQTGNSNSFVVELDPNGSSLLSGTYLGGSNNNVAAGIAVDTSGVYLAGYTNSTDIIPPSRQNEPLPGVQNAFVGKLSHDLTTVFYLFYLGGSGTDAATGIAVDSTGRAFVVGSTTSTNFPTMNPYQAALKTNSSTPPGNQNAFFTVVEAAPMPLVSANQFPTLVYSTYLGGTGADIANSVAVGPNDTAYITGNLGFISNTSSQFPVTVNTACSATTCPLMFVAKIDPSQSGTASLVYSSYLGGIPPSGGIESANGIAVDSSGDAFVTGWEKSAKDTAFPLTSFQNTPLASGGVQVSDPCAPLPASGNTAGEAAECKAGFLVEFSPDASSVLYSTFLGVAATVTPSGSVNNLPIVQGTGIATAANGDVFVSGLAGGVAPIVQVTPNGFKQTAPSPFTGTTISNGFLSVFGTAPSAPLVPPVISKAFAASSIPLNGVITLSFVITNPAPNGTALTGVGFTDTFPAGLVVATPNGLTGTCGTIAAAAGSASVSLSGATLPAGSSCTFSVSVTGASAGNFTNTTGAVTSTNGGTGNTATATLSVIAPPTLSLTFGAASVALNGTTTLSFMISNPAPNSTALTGVAFTDTFPAGLVVATPNGLTGACGGALTAAAGSASVSLSGATMSAGSSCTFSVNVTGTAAGQFTNTASAVTSTNGGTGNLASAILAVVVPASINKAFGASSIPVNGVTTLSFTVSNPPSNSAALSGVAFTDTFPSGLVVATPNGLTGTCGGGSITGVAGSASVSLTGATLAAATSCTFSVNVTGATAGTFTNTVDVSSSNGGAGNASTATLTVTTVLAPVNILDTETITVNDAPAFPDIPDTEAVHVLDQVFVAPVEAIAAPVASYSTASLGFGSVAAGQTATQILTVSNAGQGQSSLALGAPLISNSAFVLSSVSCSNGAASLLANLASGAECVLMISYTAPAGNAATGTITFADNAALSNLTSVAVGSGSYTQTVALNGSGTTTPASPLPPAVISIPLINEMITVQDSPTFPDIADTEPITVNDQVTVLTLQSIAVTPANSILAVGLTKVFTARGTYSDGSTQDLTAAVTWSSSDQAVASMSGNTATGLARGNTTITATLGSISGSTNLLVTFPFIRIAANFASITLNAAGNYDVTVSFTNTGDIVATAVQPRLALLGRALLPVNTQPALADLAPGVTATLHLVFPASAGSPGAQVAFIAIGTAAGTNPNGSPAAALWVATPLRTVVTLP